MLRNSDKMNFEMIPVFFLFQSEPKMEKVTRRQDEGRTFSSALWPGSFHQNSIFDSVQPSQHASVVDFSQAELFAAAMSGHIFLFFCVCL